MTRGRKRKERKRILSKKQKEKLRENHIGLMVKIAERHIPGCRLLQIEDLVQIAWFALVDAAEMFDEDMGIKFSTYAGKAMNRRIITAKNNEEKMIRLPGHIIKGIPQYKAAKKKLKEELRRNPTLEEIEQETGISLKMLEEIKRVVEQPAKLLPMDPRIRSRRTIRCFSKRASKATRSTSFKAQVRPKWQ
jgi:RNA polymerase primary sigma factor